MKSPRGQKPGSVWSSLAAAAAWPTIAAGCLVPITIIISKIDSQTWQRIKELFM